MDFKLIPSRDRAIILFSATECITNYSEKEIDKVEIDV